MLQEDGQENVTPGKTPTVPRPVAWLLMLSLCFGAIQQSEAQDRRLIRIAVEGAFPPFNYIDQNNELQGFEVDLAKSLCEEMQARCLLIQRDWDGIIGGLINREYDAIMSSLAITERRQKRIAFSRRYYLMPAAFLALKEADLSGITPQALAGKRIGTAERSEHATYLDALYKSGEIHLYGKIDEAILDLRSDRLDLVLGDKLHLTRFLASREGECCRLVGDAPVHPAFHGHGVGVGLRKGDEEHKGLFDRAIGQVIANGTYDLIRARFFPFDIK